MNDLALIVNTNSGNRESERQKLLRQAAKHSIPYSLTNSIDDLERALKTYAMLGTKTLVIYGGDGTVDATIGLMREQKMFTEEPALILLPGGTTNMTIRDAGIWRKNGQRFEIEINGPWTMDGEMFEANQETLTLTLEPPIRFFQH